MNFEIPDTGVINMSNAEKFTECLRIALKECVSTCSSRWSPYHNKISLAV